MSKRFIDVKKPITGFPAAVPSSSTPDYVALKNYGRMAIIINVVNATTVTGSAVTLKQATAVAGTGEKPLAFDTVFQNEDTSSALGDILAETAVTSDTFTTDDTDSKDLKYVIDISTDSLDVNNGFNAVRAGVGDATAATVSVEYILYEPRYAGVIGDSAIVD